MSSLTVEMAREIAMWPVDRLVPYAKNSRTHSAEQVAQIAASMREFGFTNPILVDTADGIIAGHGRLQAAKSLGLTEVPVIVLDHLTEAQRRAYVIADNKLALNAGWDNDILAEELVALGDEGFDIDLIGFSAEELSAIMGAEPEPTKNDGPKGSLADRFLIPPFSVLNAREGWWQDRKRAWLALGIKSELGRGEQLIPNGGGNAFKARYDAGGASPGGSPRPAMNYSKTKARGDGRGRPIVG